ncbi:PepSY-associated TM helix domain-containing protein [Orrella sp. JC864]|uniref:PepSY-associated TM helix domain-containing protein n=1 Tax=Orrella sp. JC864 TaxID=3120298 RepID=UPI00300B965E
MTPRVLRAAGRALPRVQRRHVVLLHRYVGLAMAGFLLVAALTGSLLAFREELDHWLAPELFVARSDPRAPLLDAYTLRERVARQLGPQARVDALVLALRPGETARFPVAPNPDPATGRLAALGYDEAYADPHTGRVQGTRRREGLGLHPAQLVPSLFVIHHSLALPGRWGTLLLGLVSLLWTVDCFAGAWLTLPKGRPFLQKWRPAWTLKWGSGAYRATLDLHRAGGLWGWAVLLLFAWSSVMFNLREPVFRPVMGLVFEFDDSWRSVPPRPRPVLAPGLDWPAAHRAARAAMLALAQETGLRVNTEERLLLDRRRGVYAYLVHSSLDLRPVVGNTAVLIDADTGQPRGRWLPTGGPAGNTVSNWLGALHMAHVFGRPWQVFVALAGLATAMLSITGVLVWHRKRRARRGAASMQGRTTPE